MLKTIERSKSITLLLAILFMAMNLHLPIHAGTNEFLFDMDAIKDPGSLAVKLEDTRAPVSQWIASQLSEDIQWLLVGYDGVSDPSPKLQEALLSELNRLLQAGSLYNAQVFADIELSEQTQALIAQNPKDGEALVRLNRWLLADAYPYELASLSAQQDSEDFKGIETCKENLRLIKLAREKYWIANAGADPQWLSELSPEYLDKKVLLCPADATAGVPGVLTEGAADPMLPCSYLYELRPSEKTDQVNLLLQEGDMLPIVRCEHHLLNLSAGGKVYRSGPQRRVYTSNKTGFSVLNDFMQELRAQHGEAFLKTQKGRQELKQATEKIIIKQLVPALLNAFEKEVYTQLEAQLGKNILNTAIAMDILKQATVQIRDQVKAQLQSQLETHLGAEFLKTEEGQDILEQLSAQIDVFSLDGR
ncbi:MAG: hypothetical protein OXL96_15645 [Candidatus Poribacteria bacterium]|nr:hypothetical protein [Candidatus Poribacteria bacterium]